MFEDLVFEARTEAAAVRKACQKLMVEPRMLRYEVLAERHESKRRLSHVAPFCRIHVVDIVWPTDYAEDVPVQQTSGETSPTQGAAGEKNRLPTPQGEQVTGSQREP
ncbi:MAG: hypothetical protein HUU55_23465, partial [Myxococcales bacterium]|nr:hypothetical protein [Myxococcales bacterium]